jgi:hypothetical protein
MRPRSQQSAPQARPSQETPISRPLLCYGTHDPDNAMGRMAPSYGTHDPDSMGRMAPNYGTHDPASMGRMAPNCGTHDPGAREKNAVLQVKTCAVSGLLLFCSVVLVCLLQKKEG